MVMLLLLLVNKSFQQDESKLTQPPEIAAQPYNPVYFGYITKYEACREVSGPNKCLFQPTPNGTVPGSPKWSCDPGKYCLAEGFAQKCTAGFYCPKDTAVPNYCPGGYM
jgi:hypothetical protein